MYVYFLSAALKCSHLLLIYYHSESTNLDEQFARDCTLFDSIALQVPIRSLYVEKPKILPPDIVRDIERHREELGYTDQDK